MWVGVMCGGMSRGSMVDAGNLWLVAGRHGLARVGAVTVADPRSRIHTAHTYPAYRPAQHTHTAYAALIPGATTYPDPIRLPHTGGDGQNVTVSKPESTDSCSENRS